MGEMLKGCPFCGGEASDEGVTRYTENHDAWWADGTQVLVAYSVNCVKCCVSNKGFLGGYQSKEEARERWNCRIKAGQLEDDQVTDDVVLSARKAWTAAFEYGHDQGTTAKEFADAVMKAAILGALSTMREVRSEPAAPVSIEGEGI